MDQPGVSNDAINLATFTTLCNDLEMLETRTHYIHTIKT